MSLWLPLPKPQTLNLLSGAVSVIPKAIVSVVLIAHVLNPSRTAELKHIHRQEDQSSPGVHKHTHTHVRMHAHHTHFIRKPLYVCEQINNKQSLPCWISFICTVI